MQTKQKNLTSLQYIIHEFGSKELSCRIANSIRTIIQSSISSLDYENGRFSPQTFATGSISSLNYENSHFSPQNFASSSNSSRPIAKYHIYPSPIPTRCSLLVNQSCRSSSHEMEQGPRASFTEHTHTPPMACLRRGRA
jgi:hypothetical protein